jgi:hypothetical protein
MPEEKFTDNLLRIIAVELHFIQVTFFASAECVAASL